MRRRRQQRKGSFHGNTVRSHNLTPGWLPQPLCRRQERMPSSGWSQDHPELGPGPPRGPGGFALHRHQMKMDVHPFLSSYHGAPVTQMPSNAFFLPASEQTCLQQPKTESPGRWSLSLVLLSFQQGGPSSALEGVLPPIASPARCQELPHPLPAARIHHSCEPLGNSPTCLP